MAPRRLTLSRWTREAVEDADLYLLLVVCGVAIGAHVLFSTNTDAPALLATLVALALFLIRRLGRLRADLDALPRPPSQAYIKLLHSAKEFFLFGSSVIESASISIDSCYFTPEPPTAFYGDPDIKRYWEVFADIARHRANVSCRRIVTADNPSKIKWILNHLAELEDCSNYSLAILENATDIPLLNVMVTDRNNAFVFSPHGARSRNYLWIENEIFVHGVQEYFDNLWHASSLLKDGPRIDEALRGQLASLARADADETFVPGG